MSNQLNFQIGVETQGLDKGLGKATKSIKDFAERNKAQFERVGNAMQDIGKKASILSAAIVGAATGMLMLAKNVGNVADRLIDLSDITGMSTDAIQEFQYVAKIAGVNTEALTSAAEGLTRRLANVENEASPVNEIFKKLGVSATDLNGRLRSGGDIIEDLIPKLADMDNAQERNVLGAQLFGGAWKDLAPILGMGSEGIAQAREEAQRLGLVMSEDALQAANEFRMGMDKLTAQFEGLKNQIGAKLAPVLNNTLIPLFQNKIVPALVKVADKIGNIIDWFANLDTGVQKTVGIVGGLVAALGPVLVALGGVVKILPIIIKGFALLTGPIGLTVVAIGALTAIIVKNWDTVKRWAEDFVNYFIYLYNESLVFRAGIEAIVLQFKNMFAVGKFIFQSLWTIIKAVVGNIVAQFKLLGTILKAVFTLDFDTLKQGLKDYENAMRDNISGIVESVKRDFNELTETIVGNVETAINNVLTGKKEPVDFTSSKESEKKLKENVEKAVSDGVSAGLAGEARRPQQKAVAGGLQAGGIMGWGLQSLEQEVMKVVEFVDVQAERLRMLMEDFASAVNDLIFVSISDSFSALGDVIGNALTEGGNLLQNLGNAILKQMGQFLSSFGDLAIKYGTTALFINKASQTLFTPAGIGAATGLIAAGVALKAIGGAISSAASGGLGGSGGGGATASTPAVTSSTSFRSGIGQGNEFVFRISGRDLVSVVDANRRNTDRIG
jgi:phage-related minor tail protein